MPIKIQNNRYIDIFGNETSYYKGNAGDKITFKTDILSSIYFIESDSEQMTINFITDELQMLGSQSFLDLGFRLGDTLDLVIWNKVDFTYNQTRTGTITYITNTVIKIDTGFGTFFNEDSHILSISTIRYHADLEVNFNHVLNSFTNSVNSLIDGEETKIVFKDINTLVYPAEITGDIVGNQSGEFLQRAKLQMSGGEPSGIIAQRKYTLSIEFIVPYLQEQSFEQGECLKLSNRYKFSSLSGETQNNTIVDYTENANTGYFNEANNNSVANSTLVSSDLTELAYNIDTTFEVVIDSASDEFQIGAGYFPQDEEYYKNKLSSQLLLDKVLNSFEPLDTYGYSSYGGLYEITCNSITTVGTLNTFNFTFTPLTGFDTFIESKQDFDRIFYIWVKVGNVNHLVYSSEVVKVYDNIQPLTTDITTLIRHNNNNNFVAIDQLVTKTNIEDDLSFFNKFSLTPFTVYNGVRCSIIAKNSVTNDEFTLESLFFDFGAYQINSSGQYLIDDSINVQNNLPSTSIKKKAYIYYDIDANKLKISYPFINRWEYWQTQTNADSFFYPNQNKNWLNYISGDWKIYGKIALETEDISYEKELEIPILDYDTEPIISSDIKLYREDGTLTTSLFAGEIMTIKATHTFSNYTADNVWGMITIEPFESLPRYILSTVIPFDNDNSNPLQPITGSYATKTETTSSVEISCLLDVNKLNSNAKITSKIFLKDVDYIGFEFDNEEPITFDNNQLAEID